MLHNSNIRDPWFFYLSEHSYSLGGYQDTIGLANTNDEATIVPNGISTDTTYGLVSTVGATYGDLQNGHGNDGQETDAFLVIYFPDQVDFDTIQWGKNGYNEAANDIVISPIYEVLFVFYCSV